MFDVLEKKVIEIIAEYGEKLRIDKNDLDNELEVQSDLLFKVSEQLNDIIRKRDEYSLDFDIFKAEIFAKMRKDLTESEGKKPSDTRLDKEILLDVKYQDRSKKLLVLSNLIDRLKALKGAIEQKSHSLKGLGDLYIAKYFEVTEITQHSKMDSRRLKLRK